MKRRLIVALAVLLALLPLGAALLATAAPPNDPSSPGVAPTAVAAQGTPDLAPGIAPTPVPLRPGAPVDLSPGVAPTVGGTPPVLPTPPPLPTTSASGTPGGTATAMATGTAASTGTAIAATPASGATPTGTATATATGTACPTGTAVAVATASACATATATATATPAPVAQSCPTGTAATSGQTAAIVPAALAQKEVAAARTRTARTYDAGNGQFQTVIGAGSLNYQDAQGAWQPIDDTLVAATTPGYAYQNKGNGYTVALPSDLAVNPVKVSRGNQSVSFSLVGAKGTGATCGNQVTYANTLPGVTVGYTANNDAVEETLTLASAAAPGVYTYAVQAGAGLTAKANAAGGIDFADSAGAVQFSFAPPTMRDSKGKTGKVALALSGTTATLTADAAWLADPARAFPVTIDPTINTTPLLAECALTSNDVTNKHCGGNPVVGYTDNYGIQHTVMRFDTSGYNTNLRITAAQVHLAYQTASDDQNQTIDNPPSLDVSVHPLRRDWTAGCVDWQDGTCYGDGWSGHDGGYIDATDGSTISVPQDCGSGCAWDVTTMVQAWIDGTQPNQGMRFDDDDPSHGQDDVFYYFYDPSSASAPYLSLTYDGVPGGGTIKPDLGSRPFYALAGSQLDERTSVGVNAASGNLLVSANDLTLPGIGLDFAVARTYNSLGVYKGAFGDHWTLGTGPDLWLSIYPNQDIVLQGASGFQTGFHWNGSSWDKPDGLDASLSQSGSSYVLQYHASLLKYTFDSGGRLTSEQDRNGNTIAFNYSGTTRQLTTIVDTEGRTVNFTYDPTNHVVTAIAVTGDPVAGRQWQYHYDNASHPTWLTSVVESATGASRTTTYAYDGTTGNLASITDPRGKVTSFGYEGGARTRLTALTRAGLTTGFAYGAAINLAGTTTITDATPAHNATVLTYDVNGEITQSKDAAGNHSDYVYNTNRKITQITDAKGNLASPPYHTSYAYASDNERLLTMTLPTGAHTDTTYDATCTYLPATVSDAQQHVAQYQYDAHCNRTTTIGDPGTGHLNITTTTGYNANGTIASVQDGRGHTATLSYTYSGTLLTQVVAHPPTVTSGTQPGAVTTNYDAVGRTTSVTDGKGQTTSTAYDYLDRITTVTYAGPDTVQYTYDLDSNLLTRVEGAGTTSFIYDDLNRQTSKTLPAGPYVAATGHSVDSTYDNVGDLATYTDAGGTVTYTYDNRLLLGYVTEPSGAQTHLTYDANGQHLTTAYPGGTTLTLTYDASQRLATIVGTNAGGGVLTSYGYSYASGGADTGLRQTMSENDAAANTTATYSYDALNRLAGATTTGSQPSSYQYAYDPNGNRYSATIGGAGTSATFNEADEQTGWNTGANRTYTYDANGNETGSTAGESRSYNSRNQTISITGLNGVLNPIAYLDSGQGERSSAGGSTYVNSDLGVGSETKGGATTYYTRTPSGHLVSQRTAAGTYYYLFDGLGSVVGLVDSSGNVVAHYAYDPYGQEVVKTGSAADGNPWRYTGAYLDSTGLYKMGARYYDPARGRFTQLDPAGTGYVYASDNPVNFTDPTGLCDEDECDGPPPEPTDTGDPGDPAPPAEPADPFVNPPPGPRTDPDPEADGPHTKLGGSRDGDYPQRITFVEGIRVVDVDYTDHPPHNHPDPHFHPFEPNSTGGSNRRGDPRPMSDFWDWWDENQP